MQIRYHGGKCCGIKVIEGMGYPSMGQSPGSSIKARDKIEEVDHDEIGENPPDVDFFTDAAPKETRAKRLDRLLKFLKRRRRLGVVEIVLAKSSAIDYSQTEMWHDPLIERGFKMVTECGNSNSGNRIFIYHKKFDEGEE